MLNLHSFGDPKLLKDDGTSVAGFVRQSKRFALLIFLTCMGRNRPHRRDEVITTFWPESDGSRGRNALRQSLHVIRNQLGPDLIEGNGTGDLRVNPSRIKCDVDDFTKAIGEGELELALHIYQEDFLQGFCLPEIPEFGIWVDERREDLREIAASAAMNLAHRSEGEEDSYSALFWWRRALLHRPFDEVAIRRIGALLAWSENRGEAAAEINAFSRRMMAHLGVEPSGATLDLLEKISAGRIDEINRWVGDRRGTWSQDSEPHWRRPSDNRGA